MKEKVIDKIKKYVDTRSLCDFQDVKKITWTIIDKEIRVTYYWKHHFTGHYTTNVKFYKIF